QARADLVPEGTSTPTLRFMNRRIRNRTYGGVGGGPKMPSYPIFFAKPPLFVRNTETKKGPFGPFVIPFCFV
ncbi:hypothetical protein, partial [Brucella tritici]|uniref:hypothetical protein n=1 Tax=Brucella tritici TaxID=94626 RepID=UPI001AEE7305